MNDMIPENALSPVDVIPVAGTDCPHWGYIDGDGKSAVTSDGLVVKNVDKILKINTRVHAEVTPTFVSKLVSRDVRRDFHLITGKIKKRGNNRVFREQVRSLLDEMLMQAQMLISEAEPYEDGFVPDPMTVPLRVVCPQGGILLRAFSVADKPIEVLSQATRRATGALSEDSFIEITRPFWETYKALKQYCINGQQSEQTASELGKAAGIL